MSNSATPLRPLETREVTIVAKTYNNHTDVLLEAGVTYSFRATGTWQDATLPACGPDGHDPEKLKRVRWTRRSRSNLWFALMGDVRRQRFLIGSSAQITIKETGELTCFANDTPFRYGNNHGAVTLFITREA